MYEMYDCYLFLELSGTSRFSVVMEMARQVKPAVWIKLEKSTGHSCETKPWTTYFILCFFFFVVFFLWQLQLQHNWVLTETLIIKCTDRTIELIPRPSQSSFSILKGFKLHASWIIQNNILCWTQFRFSFRLIFRLQGDSDPVTLWHWHLFFSSGSLQNAGSTDTDYPVRCLHFCS